MTDQPTPTLTDEQWGVLERALAKWNAYDGRDERERGWKWFGDGENWDDILSLKNNGYLEGRMQWVGGDVTRHQHRITPAALVALAAHNTDANEPAPPLPAGWPDTTSPVYASGFEAGARSRDEEVGRLTARITALEEANELLRIDRIPSISAANVTYWLETTPVINAIPDLAEVMAHDGLSAAMALVADYVRNLAEERGKYAADLMNTEARLELDTEKLAKQLEQCRAALIEVTEKALSGEINARKVDAAERFLKDALRDVAERMQSFRHNNRIETPHTAWLAEMLQAERDIINRVEGILRIGHYD